MTVRKADAGALKIIELTAENVKRIKAVSIRPTGNLVEISGRNGQGKSSVLDAIWWALSGTTHIQAVPIRRGATEAVIKLDLGNVKITRTFREKDKAASEFTTSLIVENADGARFPSPQTMLDKLVGELSFDPLAFARMHSKEQFEALKRFVPGFDFAADQAAYDKDFKARTEVMRYAKQIRARLSAIAVPPNAPGSRVDDVALVAELEHAGKHNADLEARRARREQAEQEVVRLEGDAARLLAEAEDLRKRAEAKNAEASAIERRAEEISERLETAEVLPAAIDTETVRSAIGAARLQNEEFDAAARCRVEKERLTGEAETAEGKGAELTTALEKRKTDRLAAITAASMPVDGLTFGDGEVLLQGLPFEQASDAERLRASIAIAMASNPKLRVIRVRDGSLLDSEAMRILADMADDRDYQIWIERVGGDGKVGFVIEDGSIADPSVPSLAAAE